MSEPINPNPSRLHLDETCKVLSPDVVVSLQVDLSKLASAHWVVLGIELVKTVEGLSSLEEKKDIMQ